MIVGVNGFLYNPKTNKILLHKRDCNAFGDKNKWSFFGGRSENDELPLDCFIREMKEELGISLNKEKVVFLQKFFHQGKKQWWYIFYYESYLSKSKMKLTEGADFDWIPIDKVFDYDLSHSAKKVLLSNRFQERYKNIKIK